MELTHFFVLCSLLGISFGFPSKPSSGPHVIHRASEVDGELGDYFEGDIVLTEEQKAEIFQRNGRIPERYRWSNGIVPYAIQGNFTPEQEQYIRKGLDTLESVTCLKFVKRTSEVGFVFVTSENSGCHSYVGHLGIPQQLNLQPNTLEVSCFRLGTIMHEFIHAIGFYHMQSASDRDDWVTIMWENIQPGTENNFNKYSDSQVTDFGVKYDYDSVMHYGPTGFSVNGQPTIVPKDPNANIGQRLGLSPRDIQKINLMYNCQGRV